MSEFTHELAICRSLLDPFEDWMGRDGMNQPDNCTHHWHVEFSNMAQCCGCALTQYGVPQEFMVAEVTGGDGS
jgi:hypothetical protein